MNTATIPPPDTVRQSHLGEAEAVDFYRGRLPIRRMHELNGHLDFCACCDDFYAAVRARESAA